jgi:general secretion pathway protein E
MSGTEQPRRGPPPPPPPRQPPAALMQPVAAVGALPVATMQPVAAPVPVPSFGLERRLIGELLLEQGVITPEQLAEALSAQHLENERVGETLVRLDHCQETDIARALARQFGLPLRLDLEDDEIQDKLVEQLPIGYARGNLVLPIRSSSMSSTISRRSTTPRSRSG